MTLSTSQATAVYTFRVTVHRLPENASPGVELALRGEKLPTLKLAPTELSLPFDVTFEATEAALSELDRLYCEPDGSFVWVSGEGNQRWQVDGHLYDRADRLLYLELQGTCPAEAFDQLLATLGWPDVPLAFQLVHEAVTLDEITFRRYATLPAGPSQIGAVG